MPASRPEDRRPLPGDQRPPAGVRSRSPFLPRVRAPRLWLLAGLVLLLISGAVGVVIALTRPSEGAGVAAGASATGTASSEPSRPRVTPSPSAAGTPSASASPSKTRSTSPVVGPPVGGAWPNAGNTGVPAGTTLTTYTGSCTITTANTVIDAKTMNCDVDIRAANVTIKRSKINGAVGLNTDATGASAWSYTLVDSEVNAGVRQYPAVSYGNMTIIRDNIYGGETSVQCGEKALTCTVQDSWLHGQLIPADANWHLGGFLSNGGHNIRIRHNTIVCDASPTASGGCTGDLNLFGDFAVVADVIADSNLLGANTGNSYCLYGGDASSKPYPHANNVRVTNNVFQRGTNRKCGDYGPVTGFNVDGTGNVWANNTWDTGGAVAGDA
jgi:hypothetical protein